MERRGGREIILSNGVVACFLLRKSFVFGTAFDFAYSAQDIQHEAPARANGVAFGIYFTKWRAIPMRMIFDVYNE